MQTAPLTDEQPAAQQQTVPIFNTASVVAPAKQASKTKAILLALLVVVFNILGNTALAIGMKSLHQNVGINPLGYLRAMANPMVASGIVLLVLWLLTRMALMSWADLTFAVPLMAIGYVLATVVGHFGLHETVSIRQWLGTLLIFAGIVVVGATSHRTDVRDGDPQ